MTCPRCGATLSEDQLALVMAVVRAARRAVSLGSLGGGGHVNVYQLVATDTHEALTTALADLHRGPAAPKPATCADQQTDLMLDLVAERPEGK